MIRIFKKREDQDEKLLKNIERYEQKKKLNSKNPKYWDKSLLKEKPIKEKKLMCEVKGVKVLRNMVWIIRGEGGSAWDVYTWLKANLFRLDESNLTHLAERQDKSRSILPSQ